MFSFNQFNEIKRSLCSNIINTTKSILFSSTAKIPEDQVTEDFPPIESPTPEFKQTSQESSQSSTNKEKQKPTRQTRKRRQNNYKQHASKDSQSTQEASQNFLTEFCLPKDSTNPQSSDKFIFDKDFFNDKFDFEKFPALSLLAGYNIIYIYIGLFIFGSPKVSDLLEIDTFKRLKNKNRCLFCGREIKNDSKRRRYFCPHCERARARLYKITQVLRWEVQRGKTEVKNLLKTYCIKDVNLQPPPSSISLIGNLSFSKATIEEDSLSEQSKNITVNAENSLKDTAITVTTSKLDKTIEYNMTEQDSSISKDLEITYSTTTAQTTISVLADNLYHPFKSNSLTKMKSQKISPRNSMIRQNPPLRP